MNWPCRIGFARPHYRIFCRSIFRLSREDALYRNLDRLHTQRVAIEAALAERERTLFGLDQTVFLYDVTSTFFEGRALANPKAKRGYSRDHRSGL